VDSVRYGTSQGWKDGALRFDRVSTAAHRFFTLAVSPVQAQLFRSLTNIAMPDGMIY
jgi:hypothetical protein